MIRQATLDFLGEDIFIADSRVVDTIISNMLVDSRVNQVRDNATFILGADVGQVVMYDTLPYEVKQVYTKEDNRDNVGRQNPFFVQEVGKIREISLVESIDQVRPREYTTWSESSTSLDIDHECFLPTVHTDLCTILIKPFMRELATFSSDGCREVVRMWVQLCAAEGNIVLFRQILDELQNVVTKICKDNSMVA